MSVQLQRITTRYVPAEDRIRLGGQAQGGATVVLWLTQRLLTLLVPKLLQSAARIAPDDNQRGNRAQAQAQAVQGFKQTVARARLEPQPPVVTTAATAAWLVLEVDVRTGPAGVGLTFKGQQQRAAGMSLAAEPLHQWLSILLDAWRTAGWSLALWPAWMLEAAPSGPRRSTTLH